MIIRETERACLQWDAMNITTTERGVVREVGLRDGLQSIARTVPTEHKLQWLRGAHAAGLGGLEGGSFAPARLIPELADTTALVDAARALPGLVPSVLVPNLKG